MKKLSVLLISICVTLILVSCGETVCSHRDSDDNERCDKCSQEYTDGKDVFDEHVHDYKIKNIDDTYLLASADCERADTYNYSCSCGEKGTETFTVGNPIEHSPDVAVEENRVEATCSTGGSYDSVVYCSICGGELSRKTQTLEKLNHSPDTAVEENRVEATCTSDGSYDSVVYCSICDEEISRKKETINAVHKVEGDACTVCGALNSTAGLEFSLNYGGKSYSLVGIGSFTGTDLVVDVYNNLPVTFIENSVFEDCVTVENVTIGNSVVSLGAFSFQGCISLECVIIGNSVREISTSTFKGCTALKSVVIGNSVKKCGMHAFQDCTRLESVYISDLEKWCNISFNDTLSNPLNFAKNLYLNDKLVTELTIPDGITSVGNYVFVGCTSITSVIIPNGVVSIGEYSFSGCVNLSSVTMPNSLTSIDDNAFRSCTSLISITIPNSVKSIGYNAFSYCSKLVNVIIGSGVKSIGSSAFYYCSSLESIKFRGSEEAWNDIYKEYDWDERTGKYTLTYNYTGN